MKRAIWKAGAVAVAALLALALITQTSEPRRAEASVGPNIASQAVVLLTSVPNPIGISSHDLNIMRDGFSAPNTGQYDTWDGNNAAAGEDYYGYGWAAPQQIARVMFTEGSVFPDGGFFMTLRLETSPDGINWTTVAGGNDASPPYPNGNDGISFDTYQWDFIPAITTQYLRVIGIAGGSAEFTSVAEFQVFTAGGVVPVDNIAPYADFVGTNAAAPTGNGARDLNVLRDGIKPAPGSFNPSLQYDTNTGAPNPAEVNFLYRWPSQRTITRIELYGGQETAEGGWWTDLRIELSSNGNDWNVMKTAADAVPVYPNAASQSFNHYTFTFATPRSGKYMRIIGPAGGTPGYISASEIEVYAELEAGEGGYYPNIAPSAAEIFGSHNAGVSQGAPSLTVINDGYAPGVDAVEPLAQFDTWNGFNAAVGPDFYAYRFAATKIFTGAAYTEGMQFTDGGWFAGGPHIEVSPDGVTWTTAPATIAPAYLNDDGHNFNRYVFTFAAPVTGQFIRLIGTAGGESEFTSVAEFEVYGGNLTSTNSVDLRLAQVVSNPTPNVGNTVTFTVTLSSNNGTAATGVTVADALPAGVTLVSATPSLGAYTAGVWSVPTLPGNSSATLDFVVTVDPGTETQTITNTASISTSNEVNIGSPTTASSSITVNGLLGDPNIAPLANLLITSVPAPLGGGNHDLEIIRDLSYPVPGTNDGFAQYDTFDGFVPSGPDYFGYRWPDRYHFTGAKFVDGMHFFDGGYFTAPPAIEVSDDGVTWAAVATVTGYQGNAAPNFTAYPLTFTADGRYLRLIGTPAGGAEFTSIAELEVYGTVLATAPNVNVTVDATPGNPTEGGTVTITVTATNTGNGDATGILIGSPIPSGLTLVSVTPSQGTYDAGVWTLGGLPAGGTRTLVFVYTTDAGTGGQTITQNATITAMTEPNPGNGSGSASVTVQTPLGDPNIAPLAVTLLTNVPTPIGGGNHDLEIIRDLSYPVPGTNNPGLQYDTFDGVPSLTEEYFGYDFGVLYHITGVKFVDGMHFGDGGYFVTAPRLEFSIDGVNWSAAPALSGYQGASAPNFTAYTFPNVNANARFVRVIGMPDGAARFTSIAELEVYGTVLAGAPDVRITVTVDNPAPQVGQNVTVTIKAKNVGTAGATGVSVPWTLPAGLMLVSTTPNTGSPWNVGNLAVDEEQTLVIIATVTGAPGVPIIVSAGPVTCTSPCDFGPGTGTVTITPVGVLGDPNIAPLANLLITSVPAPLGGGNHDLEIIRDLSYPVPGTNDGFAQYDTFDGFVPSGPDYFGYRWPDRYHFTGAKFVDGMHFFDGGYFTAPPTIEVSDDGVTWTTVATVTGYQGNAAPNFTAYPLTFTADGRYLRLIGTPAGGAEFTSIAELEVYGTVLPGSPNVNVTVAGIPANPLPGSTVTITVTATNTGDAGATGIVINSPVPAGLTLVSAMPTQGTYAGSDWTLGGLPAGDTQTLVLVVTVDAGTGGQTITHTATITQMTEPNPGNGTGSATLNIGIPGAPIVNITLTVDNPTPQVGQTVTITITATNVGSADATGVSVPWTLPAGLTLTGTTPVTGSPWNVGGLAVSEVMTLIITATVDAGTVGEVLIVDAGPLTMDQPNTGTGSGSVTITPTAALAPVVNITVTVDNPTPQVGQNVTITITATNVGSAGATGVNVPWTLPSGLTLVSTTPVSGSPWAVGSLAVSEAKTLVIVATVTGPPGQPLVVNAGPLTMDQPNSGTGTASVTITPTAALAPVVNITVTVDNPTPQVGQNVTITITATNVGTAGATGVSVPWTLPSGLTLVSTTPVSGSPWLAGSLAVSQAKTLVIVATVTGTPGQPIVVNAGPLTMDQPNTGTGSGSVTITPTAAPVVDTCIHTDGNLVVNGCFESNVVTHGWDVYKTGTLVGWTVQWLGSNPCLAGEPGYTGAQLELQRGILGPEYEGQQHAELDADCNTSTNDTRSGEAGSVKIWQDIPTVAGNWYKIRYAYKSRPDTSSSTNGVKAYWGATNVATTGHASSWTVKEVVVQATGTTTRVMFADNGTPDSLGSFIDDIRVTPTTAPVVNREVDLSWTVTDSTPNVGQNVTFILKAKNESSGSATGITIGVTIPAGLTVVSVTPNQGTYAAGVWNLGTLSGNTYKTLTVVAKPASGTAGQTLTVQGTITTMDQTNTGDGSASKSVTVNNTTREVDLSWTASDSTPNVGQNVTFVLKAKNESSGSATGITIGVTIPAGLTVVSVTPNQGTYAAGVWNLGTLSGNTYKTLTVVAKPASGTAGQTLTVQGTITTMDQTNAGDGSASKSVTVNGGSSASAGWMNVGGNIGSGSHKYTWGGSISCDGIAKKSFEYQDHQHNVEFNLSTVTSVTCSTTPGVSHGQPRAGFNTLVLVGLSSDGQRVEATFIDAGEPGRNDTVNIKVFNAGGTLISSVSDRLDGGNLQTHKGEGEDDDD